MTLVFNTDSVADQLSKEEGYQRYVYLDHLGYETIAYGRCIAEGVGYGIDEEEARYLLMRDIDRVKRSCADAFDFWEDVSPNIRETIVMLVFQMGLAGYQKFTKHLRAIADKNFDEAAAQLLDSKFAKQTPARAKRMAKRIKRG